ncbi:MAG: D-alanyl-D-alanine carboxypeptidase [Oscillospiraceae bacterium]|nr:D-alanyl-D-alanine carboxypeptidase [Oscillospiraceae bacterium]
MRKVTALLLILFCTLPCRVLAAQPEVAGKSALLMEVSTGRVLFEHNSHEPLAPASVTKVMTMLLIMEALESGKISWDDSVTTSETAAAKGGSQVYLKVGETMTVTDMLKSIAVSSANDCACAMAEFIAGSEAAFVELMNRRAAELGMNDTHFVNCTGLDDSEEAKEHRTSARDIALMSRELLKNHPEIKKFTTIWMDSVRDGAFGLSNTNKMIRFYDGSTGLKTGFTSGAGYCLSASALRDGMELIAVVMGAASSKDRFQSCKSMLDHGFAGYALIAPDLCDAPDVPVTLGKIPFVHPKLGESSSLLIDREQKNTVTTDIRLEEAVSAPVSQGQRIGTMTVKAGAQILKEIPLVAAEGVERLSLGDIYLHVLRRAAMAPDAI